MRFGCSCRLHSQGEIFQEAARPAAGLVRVPSGPVLRSASGPVPVGPSRQRVALLHLYRGSTSAISS